MITKNKYEISIWKDYLEDSVLKEKKVAVIGSDSMTSKQRAYEPNLVEEINGTRTFTFKMYYTLREDNFSFKANSFDLESNTTKNIQNPFINLLVNEAKIKVFWKNQWYDFIIKNINESSNGKYCTYTCKDLHINELSKNGFSLEFNNELENNQGTAQELGEKILEDTDWSVDSSSEIIQQEKEEPLYEIYTTNKFTALNETLNNNISIPSGSKILVFYSIKDNIEDGNGYFQFLYSPDGKFQHDYNSQLIIEADCYSAVANFTETSEGVYNVKVGRTKVFSFSFNLGVSSMERGKRLVRAQKSIFDSLTQKYVKFYNLKKDWTVNGKTYKKNDLIYGYKDAVYKDAVTINNLLVNYKNFASTEGWLGTDLRFQLHPPFTSSINIADYTAKSYLYLKANMEASNNGIQMSSVYLPDGFTNGNRFILAVKGYTDSNSAPSNTKLKRRDLTSINIAESIISDGKKVKGSIISTTTSKSYSNSNFDFLIEVRIDKSYSRQEFYTKGLSFFIKFNKGVWLEEIQFFPLVLNADNQPTLPTDVSQFSVENIYYKYYAAKDSQGLINEEDLKYLYNDTEPLGTDYIEPIYNDNFEKIRSIEESNSNRFNLLQTVAETFECWVRFNIKHDSQGNTLPQKTVSFVKEIGQETGLGFHYGIDLKSIQRTIQSDQIVTKTIVKNNENEFGKDGFTTIARSQENPNRDTFILDFGYYINQGLLDGNELMRDLYLSTGDMAYYPTLKEINLAYDKTAELIVKRKSELTNQESFQQTYKELLTSLIERRIQVESEILTLSGTKSWVAATKYVKANPGFVEVQTKMNVWQNLKNEIASYEKQVSDLDISINNLTSQLDSLKEDQKERKTSLKELHYKFFKKYSRFIQEGSWIDENYMDDDLYYLDAMSVAYESSRPQISYAIQVLRLSSLEQFKNKEFYLGDIAYIQDEEFFGYDPTKAVKTPYKEKVLISQISSFFDEPDKDTITVQNYRTQFEDLFQRITSTTQSLQFASGKYNKASSIVETDGLINKETLQSSLALNAELVYGSQNDAITYDSTGITLSDNSNPNHKTKITSNGLFITVDGGLTWKNAIRGEGIATQYLTAGAINTASITILDGNHQTFRWDSTGINAYYKMEGDLGINLSRFVRFDQYGIYGVNLTGDSHYIPKSESDIWEDASYGMTWKGFFMKNRYGEGYVEISSENDFRVMASPTNERIKIGKLSQDSDTKDFIYGIKISNQLNETVMESDDRGQLWLRDKLFINSTNNNYDLKLGYLSKTKPSTDIHETINMNNKFLVYEDGSMVATDGNFTGTINATGGKIGNMTIEQVETSAYRVTIESDRGTVFVNGQEFGTITLTAHLYKGAEEISSGLTYRWKRNGTNLPQTTKSISVVATGSDVDVYECAVYN